MRKTLLRIILPVFLGAYFSTASAQVSIKTLKKEGIYNWYNTKLGMSTDKAYKKLKKITPDTVVVAVIDSGVDIKHEDLKGHIWTNKNEIPGNGKDDDNNGYIDDVHGWNFLGNANGKNEAHARLNVTRTYARLKPKFDGVDSANVACEDRADYKLYLKAQKEVEDNRKKYENYIQQTENFRDNMLPMMPSMIAKMMNADSLNAADLAKWKPKDARGKRMKSIGEAILNGQLSKEALDEQVQELKNSLKYHYNPDFNGRKIVGDNYLDLSDTHYGNNDVAGPKPFHGTHVSGIISAIRGNEFGGDGVANCAKIMVLRAVPDGDEFDKDIALAIRYAVDNGAKVINASFGKDFSSRPKAVYDALKYAEDHGVLFVHAAGNDNKRLIDNPNFPTQYYDFASKPLTNMLTIGASTRHHDGSLAASFSNYGFYRVDIFAPGSEIYNTVPGNKYQILQGTSMAAPMVTGVIALLKGYFPSLTMMEIKDIILQSGDDFGDTEQTVPGTSKKVKFSTLSETGKVVDVLSAVKLAQKKVQEKEEEKNK